MKTLRSFSLALGIGCFVVGLIACFSGGGTLVQVVALGNTLIIAGAIIFAGILIASATLESGKRD
jgi:hypothetical protein